LKLTERSCTSPTAERNRAGTASERITSKVLDWTVWTTTKRTPQRIQFPLAEDAMSGAAPPTQLRKPGTTSNLCGMRNGKGERKMASKSGELRRLVEEQAAELRRQPKGRSKRKRPDQENEGIETEEEKEVEETEEDE
jgi:hypothetical protein